MHGRRILLGALLSAVLPITLAADAAASCAASSEQEYVQRAEVIFEGEVIGEGSPYDDGHASSLGEAQTARIRVTVYEKGSGAEEVDVLTGERRDGEMASFVSTGITPSAGETWRIYGRFVADGVVETSACDGSRYLAGEGVVSHPDGDEPILERDAEMYATTSGEAPQTPDGDRSPWLLAAAGLAVVGGGTLAVRRLPRRG